MKKNSILKKQLIAYFTIIIILMTITTFTTGNLIKKNHIKYLIESLKYSNSLIANIITADDIRLKRSNINSRILKLVNENNIRITIIDSSGNVIADTQEEIAKMDNHSNRDEIIKATQDTIGHAIRFSKTTKDRMLYVSQAIFENGTLVGYIRTSSYIQDIDNFLNPLYKSILTITSIIIIVMLIVSYFISKKFTERILRIISHANRIEKKDFSYLIEEKKNDELDQLVVALNKISTAFDYNFKAIEFEKISFEKTISVMREAVVVYDLQKYVITCNNSFNLIDNNRLLFENIEFSNFYEQTKLSESYQKKELKIGNRHYIISGVYYSILEEERVVIVFHDITELKAIAKVKSDFVANVAHELKTPLTSIYGFTETLENEVSDEHKYFLSIIKRNTNRLINIVQDLISLAYTESVENNNREINLEEVDLDTFINNLDELFVDKLKEKNMTLSFAYKPEIKIYADSFLLEHIFINLISNSIKYNRVNGFIKVVIEEINNKIHVKFIDNGIGISKENLPRIFERFYVTDTSRSKSTGGTGLGLSIVKHIVQLHNGEIFVTSELDKGSTFEIILNKSL